MSHETTIAGEAHGSLTGYGTGFVLSIILTAIPFALVMTAALSTVSTVVAVFLTAAIQILVHLHYFLHMDRSSEQRWNIMTFAFTAVVMGIFIGGSMWIMFDLHMRMMG